MKEKWRRRRRLKCFPDQLMIRFLVLLRVVCARMGVLGPFWICSRPSCVGLRGFSWRRDGVIGVLGVSWNPVNRWGSYVLSARVSRILKEG